MYKDEGPTVFIFDGFGCHLNESFMELIENDNILCVQLPGHTSDQLQSCDLGIFGNLKRWQSRVTVAANWSSQTQQLIRVLDSSAWPRRPRTLCQHFEKVALSVFPIKEIWHSWYAIDAQPALA